MIKSLPTDNSVCESLIPHEITAENLWVQAGLVSLCVAPGFDRWPEKAAENITS